ncbi:Type I restriction enzyme EcoKI specificity protein [[Flavobacterium] thermophilum]|nr:Type-1 restriction enzyme EcoKI specificity protein [Geobacillus sp. 12AMOR1]STO35717.1 Type I restriction enzyme EcoKI specificity protein [[Flavobacterium] thermophilum]
MVKTQKRNIDPRDYSEEVFELYSVPSYDLGEPEYIKGKEIGSNKQVVKENEILLCKINPRINRVWIVLNNRGKYRQLASTEWIVISENKVIYPKYLLFLLKAPYFRKLITSNVSGVGGSLTRAKPKEVETYPIALPPLNEQKRIAEKIERLFAKIDEAKRLIEEVKESFQLRRAAILDKAFKGQLGTNNPNEQSMLKTSNAIKEKDLIPKEEQPYEVPENWVWVRLKSINKDKKRNIDPRDYSEEVFELYSVPSYDLGEPEYIKGKEIGSNKQVVKENEILLCKINPRINRVWIVLNNRGKYRQLASTEWIVISENKVIYPRYLLFLLKAPYFRKLITSNVSGVGGSLTRAKPKEVETYPIALPPLNEQKRIAEKVDILLSKLETEKEMVLEVEQKLDLLKQSILNKAFRGELGTNDPTEESAIELLREVLKSR